MILFELSEQEQQDFDEWKVEHNKTCKFADPMSQGAIGGRLSFQFTPTSLGMITKVKCACGEEIDLTDVSNW